MFFMIKKLILYIFYFHAVVFGVGRKRIFIKEAKENSEYIFENIIQIQFILDLHIIKY